MVKFVIEKHCGKMNALKVLIALCVIPSGTTEKIRVMKMQGSKVTAEKPSNIGVI